MFGAEQRPAVGDGRGDQRQRHQHRGGCRCAPSTSSAAAPARNAVTCASGPRCSRSHAARASAADRPDGRLIEHDRARGRRSAPPVTTRVSALPGRSRCTSRHMRSTPADRPAGRRGATVVRRCRSRSHRHGCPSAGALAAPPGHTRVTVTGVPAMPLHVRRANDRDRPRRGQRPHDGLAGHARVRRPPATSAGAARAAWTASVAADRARTTPTMSRSEETRMPVRL